MSGPSVGGSTNPRVVEDTHALLELQRETALEARRLTRLVAGLTLINTVFVVLSATHTI